MKMMNFSIKRNIDKNKYFFDEKAAEKPVKWIERFCTHVKTELAGQKLILAEWEKYIIREIFGWKNKITGKRKYRQVYIEVPKKNGKSTLMAALSAYLICADGEPGAEVYGVAGDKDQAKIIFNDTKQMIENNSELSKRFELYAHSIVYRGGKGANFYKALSHEISTKEGYNAHAVIFDEFHTQKTRELYDVLIGSGAARSQPLFIMITTAGTNRNTICYELHEYTRKINEGIFEDEQFWGIIFTAPDDADPFSEETWKKANPGYPISPTYEFLKGKSDLARNNSSYFYTFCRYHLNWWVGSIQSWIADKYWELNYEEFEIELLKGMNCVAGLDLASTSDMCSLALLFNYEGKTIILLNCWVPESEAEERKLRGDYNYINWSEKGWLHITHGNVTDYEFIFKKIKEYSLIYNIEMIGVDPYNSSQMRIWLTDAGIPNEPYSQSILSMSEPTKLFEKKFLSGKYNHLGNPILRWAISNVSVYIDANENVKLHKGKSSDKIDPVVACIIAEGIRLKYPDETSNYESNEILIIDI